MTVELNSEMSNKKKVEIYTKTGCPFCDRAIALLKQKGVDYVEINLDHDPDRKEMISRTGGPRTVPQIFIDGAYIPGGCDGLLERDKSGELDTILLS